MLGPVVANQAVEVECVGIFRLFLVVLEAACNDGIGHLANLPCLSFHYIEFKPELFQKVADFDG
jgi:hypothetical protein